MNHVTTPRHLHKPIKMAEVRSLDHLVHKGQYCWGKGANGGRTIWIRVPGNDDEGTALARCPVDSEGWQWDGNVEKPTLKPSVHVHGHWHGWIRGGFLVEA